MLLYINDKLSTKDGVAVNYTKIVKKGDSLVLQTDDSHSSTLGGIRDWSIFKVKGGEIIEDIDNHEILLNNVMNMNLDNSKYLVEKKAILQELMDVKLKLMKGGL